MKALVIGGTGPSGPHIVNGLLARGYEVTVLHGGQHEVEFDGPTEHVHVDPHFAETLEPALRDRRFDLAIATYGRTRIIAELLAGRTSRFIAVGGGAVYAGRDDPRWGPLGPPLMYGEDGPRADDPAGPRFNHMMWVTEETILRAHREGRYEATLFRYPLLYGPNAPANPTWSIVRRVLDGRGRIVLPANGVTRRRGFAANVAHALLLAVDQPERARGQVFNVRDERQFTRRQQVEFVARRLGRSIEVVEMPPTLAEKVCGPEPAFDFDIAKIRVQLGYRDAVTPDEALARTVDWLVANRPEPGGEIERQLGDAFAYDAEDALIDAYRRGLAEAETVPVPQVRSGHMYRHPTKPGEAWTAPAGSSGSGS